MTSKASSAATIIRLIYVEYPGMAQAVFCDISTPGKVFNLYEEMRRILVDVGIPEDKIAFNPVYGKEDAEGRSFSEKRKRRGLYIQDDGKVMNADINGAANTGRKYEGRAFPEGMDCGYLYGKVEAVTYRTSSVRAKSTTEVIWVKPGSGHVSALCPRRRHEAPASYRQAQAVGSSLPKQIFGFMAKSW